MRNTKELLEFIGKVKYEQLDEKGKALGCMLPLYLCHNEVEGMRFDWIPEGKDMREYMISLMDKYCTQIPLDQLQEGDFVTLKMPMGMYHCALYLGNDELLHCTQASGLTTVRYGLYEKRIERGYRWNG